MLRIVCTWLLCLAPIGCTQFSRLPVALEKLPEENNRRPVTQVVGVWEPGEGRGLDKLPTRGFAGQIFFFSAKHPVPLVVNGQVTVYVFDDIGSPEEQSKPIHKFKFDGGTWNNYMRDSSFGPSYQLFIPYTRKGSHPAHCTIRVRYESPEGMPTYSDNATITLVGDETAVPEPVPLSGPQKVDSKATLNNSDESSQASTKTSAENHPLLRNAEQPAMRSQRSSPGIQSPQLSDLANAINQLVDQPSESNANRTPAGPHRSAAPNPAVEFSTLKSFSQPRRSQPAKEERHPLLD